jgi:hypothetical protein
VAADDRGSDTRVGTSTLHRLTCERRAHESKARRGRWSFSLLFVVALFVLVGGVAKPALADVPQGWTGSMTLTGTGQAASASVEWYFDGQVDEVVSQTPGGTEWIQTGHHLGATATSGPYSQGTCTYGQAVGSAPPGNLQVRFTTFALPAVGGPDFGIIVRGIAPYEQFMLSGVYACFGSSGSWNEGQVVAPPFLDVAVSPLADRTYPNGTETITGVGGRPLFNSVITQGVTTWRLTRAPDRDFDGHPDPSDNCVDVYNPLQENGDGDKLGDACEQTRIVIVKQTIPDDSPATFQFSGDVSGTIGDNGVLESDDDLPQGVYTVTEQPTPGWTVDSIVCADENGDSAGIGTTATIKLAKWQTVTCTFTNRQESNDPLCDGLAFDEVRGAPPLARALSVFPNSNTACEGTWVPDVNPTQGAFIPQGLVIEGRTALVSGYYKGQKPSLVRILWVSLDTGALLGSRDLYGFGHGGGLALDGMGGLWLADTNDLWRFDRATLFTNDAAPTNAQRIKLGNSGFKASFLANGAPGFLWIGTHASAGPSSMYEFSVQYLMQFLGKKQKLEAGFTANKLVIAEGAQGAAFQDGTLWVASSKSTWGKLTQNGPSGASSVGFGPGVEEIEFDETGDLWAVFEAGTHPKYSGEFYPVIARFRTSQLS